MHLNGVFVLKTYIDIVPNFSFLLKTTFSYLHANMILFIILRQPVIISGTVFSNLTKVDKLSSYLTSKINKIAS